MIYLNGKERELNREMTVQELLEQEGYRTTWVAVEKNGAIIPRIRYMEELVKPGDIVEVVSFVGGG